jgi:hypothetical protein
VAGLVGGLVGDGGGVVAGLVGGLVGDGGGVVVGLVGGVVGDGGGVVVGLVGDGDGVGLVVVQAGTVMVSESRVTAPVLASARPVMVSPVVAVIDASARMVPVKVDPVPRVAELPTCQKTLQAWAPLTRSMLLAESVVSVEPAWKMKTALALPCASSVSEPPTSSDDDALYTPGPKVWPAPTKSPTEADAVRPAASL